jgi:CRP-like cAMP-binding protein
VVVKTPFSYAPFLSHESGVEVFLKKENLQMTGAFKLRGAFNKVASLSDAERRIAITLLRIAEEQGTIHQGNVTIDPLPSQQDVANMAGTTRETVSRTYRLMEEDGYVKREGRKLIILYFKRFLSDFS